MRNVIVTGGSRGLGLAMATVLAGAGYRVIAIARHETVALKAAVNAAADGGTGGIEFRSFDLANHDGIPALVTDLQSEFGGRPILLLMPFESHLAVDTLPSGFPERRLQVCLVCFRLSPSCPHRLYTFHSLRPARHYRRLWIRRPSFRRQRDFTLLNNALLSAPYNLIRLLMAQAAHTAGVYPRELSFKHTVQMWSSWPSNAEPGELFRLIAQRPVGNRAGRSEPRVRKRRPKPFPWLKVPRAVTRR